MHKLAFNIGEALYREHSGLTTSTTLSEIVSRILPNVYITAGVILFFLLIAGGFMYIFGAGKNDSKEVEKGKKLITTSIAGFLIIFASYWIIQIIEVITGVNIFQPGGF